MTPVLRGLRTEGRRPPRSDQVVLVDGEPVGTVSSGNFSPMLECGIALAFTDPSVGPGDVVAIDVRGEPMPAARASTCHSFPNTDVSQALTRPKH